MINRKQFVLQENGIVHISNGSIVVIYDTVDEFKLDEPEFSTEYECINFEVSNDNTMIIKTAITKDGGLVKLDPSLDSVFLSYIDKVVTYNNSINNRKLAAREARSYIEKRAEQYSSMGDQLDLIIKTFKHLKANGIDVGTDAEELISISDAVKSEYPKT